MELCMLGLLAGGMHLATPSRNNLMGKTIIPYGETVSVGIEEDIPISLVSQAIDDAQDPLSILINKEESIRDFDYLLELQLAVTESFLTKGQRRKDLGPAKKGCSGIYPYFQLQDEDRLVGRAEQRFFDTLSPVRGSRSSARLGVTHRKIPVFYSNVRIT